HARRHANRLRTASCPMSPSRNASLPASSQFRDTHLTIPTSSSCPTQTQLKSGSCRYGGPICMCLTTFCCRRMPAYCQQHQSHYALKGTDEQTRGREGLPTGIGLAVFSEVGEGGLQEGLQGEPLGCGRRQTRTKALP